MQTTRFALLLIACGTVLAAAGGCHAATAAKKAPLSESARRGQQVFAQTCASCHRADSEQPLHGPGLKGVLRKKYLPSGAPANDERVRATLTMGRGNMPPLGGMLTAKQMDDVIAYLHTL